jgi:peptidylprolyl isomerase
MASKQVLLDHVCILLSKAHVEGACLAKAREERIKARKAKTFRRRALAIAVIVVVVIALVWLYQSSRQPPAASNLAKVILETSEGNITIELYDDMPITTSNFKNLVSQRVYDGTIFHRVVADFVIQSGDATSKGISVATIQDELPNKHSNIRGSVAMAKTSEPNSATSQFYINLKDNSANLDSNYSVFGRVTAGMDVVDDIGQKQVDDNDKPLQDVMIFTAELVEP